MSLLLSLRNYFIFSMYCVVIRGR